MYDTYVTIVGNVLAAPEWRRTKTTGSLVANFKVASTARRLDREIGQWVDGNSFRVRVNCWRRLAEGVGRSLMTGDPVIVVGRLYTRDWTDENGNRRLAYELEAAAVGHDLSRGVSEFVRNRPAMSTNAIEDDQDSRRIGGEETDPVPPEEVRAGRDVGLGGSPGSSGGRLTGGFGGGGFGSGSGGGLGGELGSRSEELLGADDDLGATDDSGEQAGGAEPTGATAFDPEVTVIPFPDAAAASDAAPGTYGLAAGTVGVDDPTEGHRESGGTGPGGHVADAGTGQAVGSVPDLDAGAAAASRGRGRRRGRTTVPA